MNIVIFEKHELVNNRLLLGERRQNHIQSILKLTVGDTLRIGMVNGNMGQGTIVAVREQGIEVDVHLDQPPVFSRQIDLILALPRPIMLQRIIKQATVLGVRNIYLIRSARVEKSFFHSPVLHPDKLQTLLFEGLEQAIDTQLPEVFVYHRFKPFVEDIVPTLKGSGIIAHPGVEASLPEVFSVRQSSERRILLAVGPEGGWNEYELECFVQKGFAGFSMGSRILHVDTAVVVLLGQLQLLQDMNGTLQAGNPPL